MRSNGCLDSDYGNLCTPVVDKEMDTSQNAEIDSPMTVTMPWKQIEWYLVTRFPKPLPNSLGRITETFEDRWTLTVYVTIIFAFSVINFWSDTSQIRYSGWHLCAILSSITIGSLAFFYSSDIRDGLINPNLQKERNSIADLNFKDNLIIAPRHAFLFINQEVKWSYELYQTNPKFDLQELLDFRTQYNLEFYMKYFEKLTKNYDHTIIMDNETFFNTANYISHHPKFASRYGMTNVII